MSQLITAAASPDVDATGVALAELPPIKVLRMPMRRPMFVRIDGSPIRREWRPLVRVTRPAVRAYPRASAVARPRERRGSRRVVSTRAGPDDADPEPEPSALNRSWQVALEELSSATEFEALSELARIRSVWLARWDVAA